MQREDEAIVGSMKAGTGPVLSTLHQCGAAAIPGGAPCVLVRELRSAHSSHPARGPSRDRRQQFGLQQDGSSPVHECASL